MYVSFYLIGSGVFMGSTLVERKSGWGKKKGVPVLIQSTEGTTKHPAQTKQADGAHPIRVYSPSLISFELLFGRFTVEEISRKYSYDVNFLSISLFYAIYYRFYLSISPATVTGLPIRRNRRVNPLQ